MTTTSEPPPTLHLLVRQQGTLVELEWTPEAATWTHLQALARAKGISVTALIQLALSDLFAMEES